MGACTSKHNPLTPKPAGDTVLEGATTGNLTRRSNGSSPRKGFDQTKSGISSTSRISPGLIDYQEQIQDFYMLEKKKLGFTAFSSICNARKKSTGAAYAVKTVSKSKRKMERCAREITILRMLDHPNIVKLYETYEDDRAVRLVLELCPGGELSDRILEERAFSEAHAAILLPQIFSAVEYLHSQYVCHRDIKPDNLLFRDRKPIAQSVLKLLDFDQSRIFKDSKVMRTKAGSYFYASPQVLAGKYDHSCDMWSCGVIMHLLLVGYPPFYGETEVDVIQQVKKGRFSFDAKHWSQVSKESQNLVRMLMKVSPRERFTAKQALEHEWLRLRLTASVADATAPPLHADFSENLKSFRSQHKLQASQHLIASLLTQRQISGLRPIFQRLDKEEDGMLNDQDLREGLGQAGLQELPTDYENLIEEVKCGKTGLIDYVQFLDRTLKLKLHMQEQALWEAFQLCDDDDDEKLTVSEVRQVFDMSDVQQVVDSAGLSTLRMELDAMAVGEGGEDDQRRLSFDELMAMVKSAHSDMMLV